MSKFSRFTYEQEGDKYRVFDEFDSEVASFSTEQEALDYIAEREDKKGLEALKEAVDYVSELLNHKEFDTEEHHLWSCGYADGLSDAIAIINGVDWKDLVKNDRSLKNE